MIDLTEEIQQILIDYDFGKDTPGTFEFMEATKKLNKLFNKSLPLELPVKPACFDWQKERPNKPCVFMTRVWNKSLEIYDYNIWRFEKIDCDGGWYLGWLTEDGEEWDDINDCNFDEYCIIESKSV